MIKPSNVTLVSSVELSIILWASSAFLSSHRLICARDFLDHASERARGCHSFQDIAAWILVNRWSKPSQIQTNKSPSKGQESPSLIYYDISNCHLKVQRYMVQHIDEAESVRVSQHSFLGIVAVFFRFEVLFSTCNEFMFIVLFFDAKIFF